MPSSVERGDGQGGASLDVAAAEAPADGEEASYGEQGGDAEGSAASESGDSAPASAATEEAAADGGGGEASSGKVKPERNRSMLWRRRYSSQESRCK